MNEIELPTKTFVAFFEKRIGQLEKIYNWRIGFRAKSRLESFNWSSESSGLEEAIRLKHHLTDLWKEGDDSARAKLARWIVSDWGGVRGNRANTLETHLERVLNESGDRPLQGVASYSKILSVLDCTSYAIYDARVAACLNAVQLHLKPALPLFFHYVPSQNKRIQLFEKTFPKKELVKNRGWEEIDKDATYQTYMELIRSMKEQFSGREIYHFEMILFGEAPKFCTYLLSGENIKKAS